MRRLTAGAVGLLAVGLLPASGDSARRGEDGFRRIVRGGSGGIEFHGFPPRHVIRLPGRAISVKLGAGGVWAEIQAGQGQSTVVRVDPRTDRVDRRVTIRGSIDRAAVGGGSLWIQSMERVMRVDPRTGRGVATIPIRSSLAGFTSSPGLLRYGLGHVWAASNGSTIPQPGSLWRIDPATRAVAEFHLPRESLSLAFVGNRLWVGGVDGVLRAVDGRTGQVVASVRLGSWPIRGVAAGEGGLWASDGSGLVRVDASSARVVRRIRVESFSTASLAVGRRSVFFIDGAGRLRRVDARRGTVSPAITVGRGNAVALGFGALWMTRSTGRGMLRIDPRYVGVSEPKAPWCRAGQLRGGLGGSQPAVGRLVGSLELKNVSARPCTVSGAPRLRIVDDHGQPVPVRIVGGDFGLEYPPPANWPYVVVAPGRPAFAGYEQYNRCGGRPAVFFVVTLPHAGGAVRFPGELGGRCDAPQILPWMYVAHYRGG